MPEVPASTPMAEEPALCPCFHRARALLVFRAWPTADVACHPCADMWQHCICDDKPWKPPLSEGHQTLCKNDMWP